MRMRQNVWTFPTRVSPGPAAWPAAAAAVVIALLVAVPPASAAVKLAAVFSEHMVLQQGVPAPVWGTADAGEHVTVELAGQKAEADADAAGKWMVRLQPLSASATAAELKVTGKDAASPVVVKDVLVGEVWVASGQSNMEWSVDASQVPQEQKAAADLPQVRMFTVSKAITGKPAPDVQGQWQVASPQTVGGFSAVGYFFARKVHEELKVPVGILHTSWGGTPAESWAERSALEADADLKPVLERWDAKVAEFDKAAAANPQLEQWRKDVAAAEAAGQQSPAAPVAGLPEDPRRHPWRPASLYNAMIAPLVPYAIKGAIWYQGESNAGRAYQYRKLLPAMIGTWRKAWGQGDFPFLIVSLANFTPPPNEPGDSDWAELREAQAMTAAQPNNGLAIAIDIGDAADIHPRNKQDVGKRLALAALSIAYKKDVPYSGPVYESMAVEGDKVRLKFKHADQKNGGLVAKGGEAGKLSRFAIAGEDKKWHWAEARVEGETVVVWSPQVPKPVAVRYAWANNPEGANLYNGAGLPAVPFRTDDWKGVTADAR